MASTTSVNSYATATEIRRFIYIFALTLGIQFFHMIEHVAQVLQKFVFNVTPAHGLIGQLDLEQVHFAFNTLYLATLIFIALNWLAYGRQISSRYHMLGIILFIGVGMQSYHEIEHAVKFVQFLQTGVQGTAGILGNVFNGVILHFVLNTLVFMPPVIVFFGAGLHKQLGINLRFRRA